MFETIAALCVVLGVIVVLRTVIVRLGWVAPGVARTGQIEVIESARLGNQHQLHLVQVDGRRLLLGTSESGLQRIARLPARESEVASCEGESDGMQAGEGDGPILPAAQGATVTRLHKAWSTLVSAGPWLLVGAFLTLSAGDAFAQAASSSPTLSVSIDGATGPEKLSDTLKIVMVLTAISVAPSLLLMATCFTRIVIVLSLLRQAIGTATLPPNQVIVGLALMTTFYVMTPVGEEVYEQSLKPYIAEEISGEEAMALGVAPVRTFLLSHTREEDLLLFVEMKGMDLPESEEEVGLSVLMPAFMISEIRTAFEIGFMIYLPFLVVDLVIASMLISLGMIMLPPVMIALPFKLMLFVLIDGWNLTLSALVAGI